MVELLQGFNNMTMSSKAIHGRYCECDCDVCSRFIIGQCTIEWNQFLGLVDMWSSILCPIPNSNDWHNPNCLRGHCGDCGLEMLITCPCEEDINTQKLMQWKYYKKVLHGKTKVSKNNYVLCLQYKETIAHVFLEYMRPKL
jgi:hypothetical protein